MVNKLLLMLLLSLWPGAMTLAQDDWTLADDQPIDPLNYTPEMEAMLDSLLEIELKADLADEAWPDSLARIIDFSGSMDFSIDRFYESLDRMPMLDRPVRIGYWGDSYIEADIITGEFRKLLQDRFGGQGCGWVDCGKTTNSYRHTVKQRTEGFRQYFVMEPQNFNPQLQGPSQRYFVTNGSASVSYSGTDAVRHQQRWDKAMLYFRTASPFTISVYANGDSVAAKTFQVKGSRKMQCVSIGSEHSLESVRWDISGAKSDSYFFGAANDPLHGIQVDNFSVRGCTGLNIADIPQETMRDFALLRPYDLIVLQFGLNSTTASATDSHYDHYCEQMRKVIRLMKRTYPNAAILLVSVPDRGVRTGGGIQTMKGILNMLDHQEMLAEQERINFYNLYEAQGGAGASRRMSQRGMLANDLLHINFKGGAYVAHKLIDALLAPYIGVDDFFQ